MAAPGAGHSGTEPARGSSARHICSPTINPLPRRPASSPSQARAVSAPGSPQSNRLESWRGCSGLRTSSSSSSSSPPRLRWLRGGALLMPWGTGCCFFFLCPVSVWETGSWTSPRTGGSPAAGLQQCWFFRAVSGPSPFTPTPPVLPLMGRTGAPRLGASPGDSMHVMLKP